MQRSNQRVVLSVASATRGYLFSFIYPTVNKFNLFQVDKQSAYPFHGAADYIIKRHHNIRSQAILNSHGFLWRQHHFCPVVRGYESHTLLCNGCQMQQRHHLESPFSFLR